MENSDCKIYTLFAGINGAGKSTLYFAFGSRGFGERLNSDEIIAQTGGDWRNPVSQLKAGIEVLKRQNEYFEDGLSMNRETTLSERSILKIFQNIKNMGYKIHVYYIGLDSLDIAKERIKKRVEMGGHGIDDYTLELRYKATQKNLKKIIPYCELLQLYDNSGSSIKLVGFLEKGEIIKAKEGCKWLDKLIVELEEEKSLTDYKEEKSMSQKMKRKYLIDENEYFGVDSLEEFLSLFGKFYDADKVVSALQNIALNIKDEQDKKLVEEVIFKHIVYNNSAGMYKDEGKTYQAHRILSHKMPEDLEKVILEKSETISENKKTNENSSESFEK